MNILSQNDTLVLIILYNKTKTNNFFVVDCSYFHSTNLIYILLLLVKVPISKLNLNILLLWAHSNSWMNNKSRSKISSWIYIWSKNTNSFVPWFSILIFSSTPKKYIFVFHSTKKISIPISQENPFGMDGPWSIQASKEGLESQQQKKRIGKIQCWRSASVDAFDNHMSFILSYRGIRSHTYNNKCALVQS